MCKVIYCLYELSCVVLYCHGLLHLIVDTNAAREGTRTDDKNYSRLKKEYGGPYPDRRTVFRAVVALTDRRHRHTGSRATSFRHDHLPE